MPIVVSGPYPSVETILNLSRAIVNDMTRSSAGLVLTDTAPYTLPLLNASILRLQQELTNNGVTAFKKDNVILTPILPVETSDPSVQTYVSFDGYFDGTQMWPSPVLPPDLVQPEECWERITGTNNQFTPMQQPSSGLPSIWQGSILGYWEWRQDRINFIGSLETEDVRLRYIARILMPIQTGSDFTVTTVGSIECENALAYDLAARFSEARGALTQGLQARRDEELGNMVSQFVRRQQTVSYQRDAYGDSQQIPGPVGSNWLG